MQVMIAEVYVCYVLDILSQILI